MIRILLNPFHRIAGVKALLAGLAGILVSSLLGGWLSTRFDGAIDAHYGGDHPFFYPLLDQLTGLVCLTAVFYLLAAVLTKGRTRLIDIAGTFALARCPYLLMPLLNTGHLVERIGNKTTGAMMRGEQLSLSATEISVLIVTGVLALLIIAWYIALLYKAYTVSSNLKGARAIVSFITGLLLSEIVTIILIHTFLS